MKAMRDCRGEDAGKVLPFAVGCEGLGGRSVQRYLLEAENTKSKLFLCESKSVEKMYSLLNLTFSHLLKQVFITCYSLLQTANYWNL